MTITLAYNGLLKEARGVSRRKFIKGIGAVAAGAALLAIGGQLIATRRLPEVPGEALVRSIFAGRVGETFHIDLGVSGVLALQLFKVRDLRAASKSAMAGSDDERRFSILFRGPADRPLGQESYVFEHDQIGRFALFIVPMRPEQEARYYEVIFNRQ